MAVSSRTIQFLLVDMEGSYDHATTTNLDEKGKEEMIDETMEHAPQVADVPAPKAKARGKRSTSGPKKPKTPIVKRPFKKISNEVLTSRIADMSKKLEFMTEKMTQLRKRFELHEHEQEMRKTEANSPS